MSQSPSDSQPPPDVCLVVQDFLPAWTANAPEGARRWPALDKLVRRGQVEDAVRGVPGFSGSDLTILEALQVEADSSHARGPVEWLGHGGAFEPGTWVIGEWLHLEIGSHQARLRTVESLPTEAALGLAEALKQQVRFAGLEIRVPPDAACIFLHSASGLDAMLASPVIEMPCELPELLPQGRDGPTLRRLLTEAQMVLHEHPVNTARERAGKRSVNVLWLSGLGEMRGVVSTPIPELYGESAWLRGLARLHATYARPEPATAQEVIRGRTPAVVVLRARAAEEGGPGLDDLESNWFVPLATALHKGQIASLVLFLDTWRVRVDRARIRRFWKRGRSLSELLQ